MKFYRIAKLTEKSRLLSASIKLARKHNKPMAENFRIEKAAVDRQLRALRRK